MWRITAGQLALRLADLTGKRRAESTRNRQLNVKVTNFPGSTAALEWTQEQEFALIVAARSGDRDAERKLIEANMDLVHAMAQRVVDESLAYEEVIAEGIEGLRHAIRNFSGQRSRFSTYASYWVRQYIGLAVLRVK